MHSQYLPLHHTAKHGKVEFLVKLLASRLYAINKKNLNGKTPLHVAAEKGCTKMVKLLLAYPGVDASIEDMDKWTPIYYAVSEGHIDVVKELLAKCKVDINKKDASDLTLLHLAIYQQRITIAKLLLNEENIAFNTKDCEGKTPLHLVVQQDNAELVDMLLTKGADPYLSDNAGNTSFEYGLWGLNRSIIRSLLYHLQQEQYHALKTHIMSNLNENEPLLTCLIMMGEIQPSDISHALLQNTMEKVLHHLGNAIMRLTGKEVSQKDLPYMLKALPYGLNMRKYIDHPDLTSDRNLVLNAEIIKYLCQGFFQHKREKKVPDSHLYADCFYLLQKKLPKEIVNQIVHILADDQQMSIYQHVIKLKEVVPFYPIFHQHAEKWFQFYSALSEHDWQKEWTSLPSEPEFSSYFNTKGING